MKTNNKYLLIFLFVFLNIAPIFAQGWERIYSSLPNPSQGYAVALGYNVFLEDDGGYLVYGLQDEENRFIRTDANGFQVNALVPAASGSRLIKNAEGDYIFGNRLSNNPAEDIVLRKVDGAGNLIWDHRFGTVNNVEAISDLIQSSDGDYVFVGAGASGGGHIYKTNENGTVVWKSTYNYFHDIYNLHVVETNDNGFLISGSTNFSTPNQPYVSILIRFDENGVFQSYHELASQLRIFKVLIDQDDYLFWGTSEPANGSASQLLKADSTGAVLWTQDWAAGYPIDMIRTEEGGLALLNSPGYTQINLIKADANGNTEWLKEYGGIFDDLGRDLKQTPDKGFIITGTANGQGEDASLYLIKTDSLGNALTNIIEGYVQYDTNEDCVNDPGEQGLKNWIVSAESPSGTFYATADSDGYYAIEAEIGSYDVSVTMPNAYWSPCIAVETVQLNTNFDTTQVDFAIQSIEQCPLMEVQMQTSALRACEENRIWINCRNNGTLLQEEAYVEITFADSLELVNASIPYTLISGNTYSFDIGDMDFLESIDFFVGVNVGCSEELLGQTLCSEALIFPDTTCLPLDSLWSGASVALSATCEGGEAKLKIKNVGLGAMQDELYYIVVEDDVIMSPEPFGPLEVADSMVITRPADGTFYRIESDQVPFHPGVSMPSAFIEACGEDTNGDVSLGFVNLFPLNDGDPFVDVLCQEVVASYDPNIKEAFPEGYDEAHFIEQNTRLEYVIHFQNTGTAMANLVVIEDRLTSLLNPTTIRPGASSHPYEFELFSDGIMRFTFQNIMLPDSTSDEVRSHGFVQFTIDQQKDLPIGTEIRNEAAIYFDANVPIITNQTLHTIGEELISVGIGPTFRPEIAVNVYPNPFDQSTTFEVEGANTETLYLEVSDALGRTIRTEQFTDQTYNFNRGNLIAGLYFYRISDGKNVLNTGRILVK